MTSLPVHVANRRPANLPAVKVVESTLADLAPKCRPAVRGGPSLMYVLVLILVLFGSAGAVGVGLSLI